MKIPDYEPQVGPASVTMPTPQFARPVESAYTGVPQAVDNLANTGVRIGELMMKRAVEKQAEKDAADEANIRNNMILAHQDFMYSKEPIKVKSGDNEYETTKGTMFRELGASANISKEYEDFASGLLKNSLKNARTPEQAQRIRKDFMTIYQGARESHFKSEAIEGRKSYVAAIDSNQKLLLENAALVQTPEAMQTWLPQIVKNEDEKSAIKSLDKSTADIARKEAVGDFVSKAAISTLELTGDIDKAMGILNSVYKDYGPREDGTRKGTGFLGELNTVDGKVMTEKSISVDVDGKNMLIPLIVPTLTKDEIKILADGKEPTKDMVGKAVDHAKSRINNGKSPFADETNMITPERYKSIKQSISEGIDKINDRKNKVATQVQINNTADLLTSIASGQQPTVDEIAQGVRSGKYSERLGKAANKVIKSKGTFTPSEAANEDMPEFIDKIYLAKDQVELHDALLNILENNKNMGEEELAIYINSALNRGKVIPVSLKDGFSPTTLSPKDQAAGSAALAVTRFGRDNGLSSKEITDMYVDYQKGLAAGMLPQESYNMAVQKHVVSVDPTVATWAEVPTRIKKNPMTSSVTFRPGAKVYPHARIKESDVTARK